MSTNATIALSDLAEINPGVNTLGLSGESWVSFIPMSDVSDGGQWIARQQRRLSEVRVGYTPFAEGDVLFAKITPCMENGKGAHVTGLINGVGFGSTEFHVVRTRGDNDPRFLYHWLQARPTRTKAIAFMGGSAGQQRVQAEFFTHFRIPRIESKEQSRIAAVLDTVDEAIAKTEAMIAKLKQVRAGLLHDLLTRGLDEHGQLRDPIARPQQFCESAAGLIPRSWSVRPIRECLIGSPQNGLYKPARQIGYGLLLIGQTCITDDRTLDISEARRVELSPPELEKFALRENDILISRVFATLAGLGLPALVPALAEPAVYESNMMRLRVDTAVITPCLLFEMLRTHRVRARIVMAAHLSNQASINQPGLNPIPICVPPSEEQRAIVTRIAAADEFIKTTESELAKLEHVKLGLMTDLLTGRLRVPESLSAVESPS
jgi:type I restriction enzyme, S subunit